MAKRWTIFREAPDGDTDGKVSVSRIIAAISIVVGTVVVFIGINKVLTASDAELAKVYKDIIVAGLGVFTAGGITKAVNRIGEGLKKK